jgi:hypothetical protein
VTFERKALTSFLLALCLPVGGHLVAAADVAEKPAEAPAKGKEEAPAEGVAETPAKPPAKVVPPAKAADPKAKATDPPAGEMPEKEAPAGEDADAEAAAERDEANAGTAVARPVSSDPVQVYGWREWVMIGDLKLKLAAKLDTGALTSSIHAEEKELFERDGKKWVRFIVTDPGEKNSPRNRIEAPLVRIALIKEPGGKSESREVVRLNFTIGERKLRADFTLNNRSNMLSPVLIGRSTIKEIGWVDPSRAYLADQKIMR